MHTRKCECPNCIEVRSRRNFDMPVRKRVKIEKNVTPESPESPSPALPPESPESPPPAPPNTPEPTQEIPQPPPPVPELPTPAPVVLNIEEANNFMMTTRCNDIDYMSDSINYVNNCLNAEIITSRETPFTHRQVDIMKKAYELIK